jgi:hypothetical protein
MSGNKKRIKQYINHLILSIVGVAGFGDKLVLSFGNITKSFIFEDKFLQFLSSRKIQVEREINS